MADLNTASIRESWSVDDGPEGDDVRELCDEVDRLTTENETLQGLVRRLYTADWIDPPTDEQARLLERIVPEAGA